MAPKQLSTKLSRRTHALCWALCVLILGVGFAGCGGEPPKSAASLRPLDPRRAALLIATVVREQGERPATARQVEIAEGKMIDVDVGAAGRKFGIAYTTAQERQRLGAALPQSPDSDALVLVSGMGDEADARILVLNDSSYLYDDHVGTAHEQTTITAENKLKRDVRDFLVRARAEKWP